MSTRKRSHRVRDYVLYIAISFAVVAIAFTAALTGFGRGWGEWVALGVFTYLVFHYWIRMCKPMWRRRSFWLITSVLFIAHLTIWSSVVRTFGHIPTFWYWVTVPVEVAALAWCADLLNSLHRKNISA